ncbi:hypothetical protein ACFLZ1_00965 [Patescibacteria group bacterium]
MNNNEYEHLCRGNCGRCGFCNDSFFHQFLLTHESDRNRVQAIIDANKEPPVVVEWLAESLTRTAGVELELAC